jgi:hypothetical protein
MNKISVSIILFVSLIGYVGALNAQSSTEMRSDEIKLHLDNYTHWNSSNNTLNNAVYVDDLNGDGKIEVITLGNFYNSTDSKTYGQLRIWNYTANNRTRGVLNLKAERTWTDDTTNEYSVVVDDLNHDGHKKIITGGATRDVLDSNYDGWIEWLTRIITGGVTRDVWDNADLRIWNYTNGEINLEAVKNWYMVNVTNFTTIFTVTTGDINNDGHDEIITGGMGNATNYIAQLSVWNYTNSMINLIAGTEWRTNGRTEIQSVRVADLDHDGTLEIIAGGLSTGGLRPKDRFQMGREYAYQAEVSIFKVINNTIKLENRTKWQSYSDTIVYSVAARDIDNDGDVELVTGGLENDGVNRKAQLRIWNYSNNKLNLEHEEIWNGGGDTEIYSILLSDINADGKMEIITAGMSNDRRNDRGEIRIYTWLNNKMSLRSSYEWSDGRPILEGELDDSLKVADLNNDSTKELITGGRRRSIPTQGILRAYSVGN